MAAKQSPAMRRTGAPVEEFLARVPDQQQREDARRLCAMMQQITGEPPAMWGTGIIGFGTYHYRYASGREGDWPAVGFSPRKQALTIYVSGGFDGYDDLLTKLGPHSTGKSCLYLKRLSDVDEQTLRALIAGGFRQLDGTTVNG